MSTKRHVLSILVENRFGELARIVGLFSGRGFNIDKITASPTLDPSYSRVILVTRGDEAIIEQITKQAHKLIRVRRVHHVLEGKHVERELCLATVNVPGAKAREDLERIIKLVGARVIAYAATAFTLEVTATSAEVDNFIEMLRPLGIRDMVRSAPIALQRPLTDAEQGPSSSSAA